jgi:dUTPase
MNYLIIFISTIILFDYLHSNNNYTLNVCSSNDYVLKYYSNYSTKHKGDSGVDLVIPNNGIIFGNSYVKIDHEATFVLTKNNKYVSYSYYLYARSSLSTIPLIIPNSVGIIDAGFRGKLSTIIYNPNNHNITYKQGDKFSQICASDLSEIIVKINCDIPNFGTRGANGFGSTS